jgi:hypothetical protein
VADKFKYVEAGLHDNETSCAAAGHRLGQMVTAWSGYKRRPQEHPFDQNVVTGLFDAVMAAAGLTGREILSAHLLGAPAEPGTTSLLYKHSLGMLRSTASLLNVSVMGKYL